MIFWERFGNWLEKPYSDEMSAGGWFAFLGLVFLLTLVWSSIIKKLTD